MNSKNNLTVLYDGICCFCNSTVQLIIHHDKKGTIRFAAIQSSFAALFFEHHPTLKKIDSLIVIESINSPTEKIYIRSNGALVIARNLSGWWNLFLIGYIAPTAGRDWFYDILAKYRYRLFAKYDSCLLLPSEVRSRFIDIS